MSIVPSVNKKMGQRVVVPVAGFVVSNDEKCILSTYGLGTCVALIFCDISSHMAGMLHLMLPDSTLSPEKSRKRPAMVCRYRIRSAISRA